MGETETLKLGNDLETRIWIKGQGPALLLIHGLAASLEIWDAVAEPLSRSFRVIAFDLPGFGRASKPDVDYRYPFFLNCLTRVYDRLGLSRAQIVGSSLGASLAIRFAAAAPERVDRLTLAAPGGFGGYIHPFLRVPTAPLIGGVLSRPNRMITEYAVRLTLADRRHATQQRIDLADELSRSLGAHRAFVRTLRGVATPLGVRDRKSFERDARGVTAPSSLIWGLQDRIFPVRQAQRAQRLLPDTKLVALPRCGHYPQVEAPERLIEAIRAVSG